MDKNDINNDWSGLRGETPIADKVMGRIRTLPPLSSPPSMRACEQIPTKASGMKRGGVWFRTDNTWTKLPFLAQCITEPYDKPDGRWGVKWWEPEGMEQVRTFLTRSEARAFVDAVLGLK